MLNRKRLEDDDKTASPHPDIEVLSEDDEWMTVQHTLQGQKRNKLPTPSNLPETNDVVRV